MDKTARLHFECSRGIVAVKPLPYLGGAKKWYGERKAFFSLYPSLGFSSFFCGTGISKQFVVVGSSGSAFFRSRVMTMVRPHATAPPKKNPPPFRWNRPPRFTVMGEVGGGGEGPPLHTAGYKPDLNLSPVSSTEEEGAGETFFYIYLLVFSISDPPRRQKRRPWLSMVIGFFDKWAAMAIGAGFDHFLHICG